MIQYLDLPSGAKLAYCKSEGSSPGVIFLGGFMSDMAGTKATALESHCKEHGIAFIRFDYQGHGESSGRFEEGNIGLWTSDAIAILDALADGPQILIGSSMGGWIMLLTALARKENVAGLVGIAAAPDFPTRLMWDQLTQEQRAELEEKGIIYLPCDYGDEPYPIRHTFIEESRSHILLNKTIALDCPIHLLHGMKDHDVPYQMSAELAEKVISEDVQVSLVKDADHRFSEPKEIALLHRAINAMLEKVKTA